MDLVLTGEMIAIAAGVVWAVGMVVHFAMCVRDIRKSMHVEQNCRAKDVKNYYRLRSREAARSLKMAPIWPLLLLDVRETAKAVKRYRELNKR